MVPGVGGVVTWWRSPARARHLYPAVATIGLTVFLAVYGPGQVFGTNTYWQMPQADEGMAVMGYRYFLHGSWHWPLFASDAINVPYVKSVAFLDCIPIWALANKALATILPPWESFSAHAYLGMWHAIAYVLQACFGVACLRALGHRSWGAGIATALFVLAIPTWIFRYAHPALSAHWILLWALYLYLQRRPRAQLVQLSVAALVTPYHAAMSLAVFAASLRDLRTLARWLPLGIACVAAASWLAGYFTRDNTAQWGFEWNSANALSWLLSVRSGLFGDERWIANVTPTAWQYEGYAYLGAGVILLLVAVLADPAALRGAIRRHPALAALACGAALFALSNHVFVGGHDLGTLRVPHVLRWITHQFRSPGRFVWLPTYVLVVFLLHWAARRRRFVLLGIALVLQLADVRGDWAWQRATTTGAHVLDLDAWRPIVQAHRAVTILPPYGCVTGDTAPELDHVSMEIQYLASERALPINGTYSARAMRHCELERAMWPTIAPEPGMLYVLLPEAHAVADRLAALGAHCTAFAYGQYCD